MLKLSQLSVKQDLRYKSLKLESLAGSSVAANRLKLC